MDVPVRLRVRLLLFTALSAFVLATAAGAAGASPGALEVCKVASGGIASGTVFEFRVTLSGVSRTVNVETGSCVELPMPFAASAHSKGWFKTHPSDVGALIPPDSKLIVDGATLSAAQVQSILRPASTVSAQSSLLLNLTQQLLAADLNILAGIQAPPSVLAAITAANDGIAIATGPGGSIVITTSLTKSQMSGLVRTLTAFNEGKLLGGVTPTSLTLLVAETIPAGITVTGIACLLPGNCSGADTAAGTVNATVVAGETTTVTVTNASTTLGTLLVCKAAGTHIDSGQVFEFQTPAGTVQAEADGDCAELLLPGVNPDDFDGHFRIFEQGCGDLCLGGDLGWAVSAIGCEPVGRCIDTSLGVGTATVDVVVGDTTTVTFTNRATFGTLRLCKAAGTGIEAGASFDFSTPLGDRTVAADGDCTDLTLPEVNDGDSDGHYRVSEKGCGELCLGGDLGWAVSAITCDPVARCTDTSLGVGQATIDVVGGEVTTVTFTNRATFGTLRLCKAAGAGITPGATFSFSTPKGDVVIAADGDCSDMVLPEVNAGDSDGHYRVAERGCGAQCIGGDLGWAISSVTCDPVARCVHVAAGVGVATIDVVGGETVTVTFTNRATWGTLRICKSAGAGIAPGSTFDFLTPLGDRTVAAGGACVDLLLPEVNAGDSDGHYRVYERGCGELCLDGDEGFTLTSVNCDPVDRCVHVSLGVGQATIDVVAAAITTVTFTNAASGG